MLRIVPQKIKTITIIGSKGEMGKIFKSSFQKQGLRVIEIEQKTPFPKWESLLADSQMIIVSVPIEKTPAVVQKILPYLKPHQIFSIFPNIGWAEITADCVFLNKTKSSFFTDVKSDKI